MRSAVSRVNSNSNAIVGLLGEQRVRERIPDKYSSRVVGGCWLVSNYLGNKTRHVLLIPQIFQAGAALPESLEKSDITEEIEKFSSIADSLGIPTFYCIPYAYSDENMPDEKATQKHLKRYAADRNLVQSGTKSELIERIASPYSNIEYMTVDVSKPDNLVSLESCLLELGYPLKQGRSIKFAQKSEQDVSKLSEITLIEEFWKRHLWWKIKTLTSSHCADIDALYLLKNGISPFEIKSKSIAPGGSSSPDYFGIDVGTIAKMLKFSELGTGGGEGIYVVEEREGDEPPKAYHATTMSNLYANMELHTGGGGASGFGGGSTEVVKVPIHTFSSMDEDFFDALDGKKKVKTNCIQRLFR